MARRVELNVLVGKMWLHYLGENGEIEVEEVIGPVDCKEEIYPERRLIYSKVLDTWTEYAEVPARVYYDMSKEKSPKASKKIRKQIMVVKIRYSRYDPHNKELGEEETMVVPRSVFKQEMQKLKKAGALIIETDEYRETRSVSVLSVYKWMRGVTR